MTNAVFTYQWWRESIDPGATEEAIPGATGQTYTVADGDASHSIWVVVTFTDDAGNLESIPSNKYVVTPPIEISGGDSSSGDEPVNTVATGEPEIDGTARVGETLTATTSNIADADGMTNAVFTYQWKRIDPAGTDTEGEDIPGATGTDLHRRVRGPDQDHPGGRHLHRRCGQRGVD